MNARSVKQVAFKPQDLVVTLKLALVREEVYTFAQLAGDLFMSASEVHAAVQRAELSRLLGRRDGRPIVNRASLKEFVLHGVRFAFPPVLSSLTRGMPTGVAAPPLDKAFQQGASVAHVWPDAEGAVRGIGLCPLYPSVPAAAKADPALYELLALIDAQRAGAAREREAAEAELNGRFQ